MRACSFYHVVTCAEHALFVAQRSFRMSANAPSLPSPGVPVAGEEGRLKCHAPDLISVNCSSTRSFASLQDDSPMGKLL